MTSHDLGRKYYIFLILFRLFIPRSGRDLTWADPVGSNDFSKWEGEGSYRDELKTERGQRAARA